MSSHIFLIGKKAGMVSFYDQNGSIVPLTIVKIGHSAVVGLRTKERDGYTAVMVAGGGIKKRESLVSKPQRSLYKCSEGGFYRVLKEFRVSPEVESNLSNDIIKDIVLTEDMKGSLVDVSGTTKGKGFQGPMKRHGFAGLPASHGTSVTHRSHGSTGCRSYPGRVFKGKKMAGHMGDVKDVKLNVKIHDVDVEKGLVYLFGSIPGSNDSLITIKGVGARFMGVNPMAVQNTLESSSKEDKVSESN